MKKLNKDFKRIPDNLDILNNEKEVTGAYLIVNPTTNETYVGSTNDLCLRKRQHETSLNNNKHHNKNLQKAFNNGATLEFVGTPMDNRDIAYDYEQSIIDEYHASGLLYNRTLNARDGYTGIPVSDETREKLRQSHLGKKPSPESIEKIRLANTGKKRSPEFSQKMSDLHKGKKLSPQAIENIRLGQLNKVIPEKEKDRLRTLRLGSTNTPETNLKVSIFQKNRIRSEEEISRLKQMNIGKKLTAEQSFERKNNPNLLMNARKVSIENNCFISINEAARFYNISRNTVIFRIESKNPLFSNWNFI